MASLPKMLTNFIQFQCSLSRRFDALLPTVYSIDGNRTFQQEYVPAFLAGTTCPVIYDVGGGKNPYISNEQKLKLNAVVVGLDISQAELDAAPPNTYDRVVCADISTYRGNHDADVVICQTLMEHVQDVPRAFAALSEILKPGGILLIFVPSRNAVFARLNLILPEALKRRILFAIFPHTRRAQGFASFYNHCTPAAFRTLAEENLLDVVDLRLFYCSMYFSFFTPLHVIWRLWIVLFRAIAPTSAAETFAIALRKR
jgi:SAM-dependent methyltransferase